MKKHFRTAPILALVPAAILFCGSPAHAQVACPPTITVEQKATPPTDWSVEYPKTQPALSSATIFEGPPEENASLKYDDQRTAKTEMIQTWKLPQSDHGHWIVCGYTNTAAKLQRKLSDDLSACEVVMQRGVTYGDGSAIVKRAECTTR